MIVLDTHIWIWLLDNNSHLTDQLRQIIVTHQPDGLDLPRLYRGKVR